jgi:hypothetical protein
VEVSQKIKLIDALGRVVFETRIPLATNQDGIDVSGLNTGMYLLQIVFDQKIVNQNVVVK